MKKQSEERFRALVEATSDWVWAVDQKARYTYASPKVRDLLGYEPEEVVGKTPFDFMPPDEAERVARVFEDIARTRRPFARLENLNLHKDGRHVMLETSGVPILDAAGSLLGYRGVDRDITERKQAEEALREARDRLESRVLERTNELQASNQALAESEEKYRRLFEAVSDAVLVFDAQTRRFVEVNEEALRLYGYTREEFLQLTYDVITADPEDSEAAIAFTLAGVAPRVPLRHHRKKGGKIFPVEISASTFSLKGRRMLCGIARDITARQEAEALLRTESAFNAAVLDTARAVILVLDASGRIVRFNRFCEEISGYSAAEAIGRHVWDFLLIPEELEGVKAQWELTLRIGGDPGYESSWKTKDGQLRRLFWRSAVIPDDKAMPEYVVAIALDITERQQAEDALRKSGQELADFFAESPLGLLWVGPDGRILRVNRAELDLLGYSGEEIFGRHVSTLHAEAEVPAELLDRLAKGETVQHYRARVRTKSGGIKHVLIEANGFWEKDRLIHSRWFVRDITRNVELEREILAISERERRRLGEDLHDDLCQQLAGIEFLSQTLASDMAARSKAGAAQAKEIAQMVQQAMKQARELAQGLAPVALEAEGLAGALHELAARTKRIFRCDCRFRSDAPVLVPDPTVAIHLYRIAQEAVGNALKHGKARRVEIALTANGDSVTLEVKDNGLGIAQRLRKRTGMGLRIMHHRAAVIGGSLVVDRQPSTGTSVLCTVPDGLLPPDGRTTK